MANRVKTWVSETLTAADLNGEFNNIYAGTIARTAGNWASNDDVFVNFGSSDDAGFHWNTTQTNDCLVLALSGSRTLLVVDDGDYATDFALANRSHPSIIVHSSTAANANDYIEIYHNAVDSYINSGAGEVVFAKAGTALASVRTLGIVVEARDMGANAAAPCVEIRRNTNATPSASTLSLWDRAGTQYFLWVDATGDLRIHTAAPTTAASDTVGTVVGSQS